MPSSLPSGTVTLLFSDIESSTQLLHQLGDVYADLLAEHRRLMREAFAGHGGVEVDTQGDAFFVAFQRAQDAVAAAVEAQRAFAAHDWPGAAGPRVRMAIHSGEPSRIGEGLVGLSVHRAARICSAGHGGQVLLSATTRDLVDDHLPSGVALVDLGEHRLKDLDRPERIVQLVIEGLPPVFTPLKPIAAQPVKATPFAGQEAQLAAAAQAAMAGAAGEEAPARAWWSAAARARALDWRQFIRVPGRRRLANSTERLGFSIHATAHIAPRDDLDAELRALGLALATAARDARDADRLLRNEDKRMLKRRMAHYRDRAASDRNLRAADLVATHIAALTVLAETRRQFEEEARRLGPRVRAIRTRVFDARLDSSTLDDLVQEVRALREAAVVLSTTLHQARGTALRASTEAGTLTSRDR